MSCGAVDAVIEIFLLQYDRYSGAERRAAAGGNGRE
jgi:hypothetical protein